jgi:hypothetical protein
MPTPLCEIRCVTLCGKVLSPPAPLAPPQSVFDIMEGSEIVAGWDAAIGVSGGATVAQWNDLGSGGFNLTQAAAGFQPTFNAEGGPNGNPSILFDGVDDALFNAALDLPAPGTIQTFYWAIVRQVSWILTAPFWGAGASGDELRFVQAFSAPDVTQRNGIGGNQTSPDMPINMYRIVGISFTNTISDYIDISGARTTGINTLNNDPVAGFFVGWTSTGQFGNIELCELWIFNTLPTPAQLALLDAYASNRYGVSVIT